MNQQARVVACFCEGMTVRGLLKAIRRHQLEGKGDVTGELIFVGSDGWSDRYDVIEGYEKEAVGGISVRIYSPYVHEFDDYYFSLSPENNTRNPWFREFCEHKFNCTLPPLDKNLQNLNSSNVARHLSESQGIVWHHTQHIQPSTSKPMCTGREKLSDRYKQDTKMAFVMKSIWTAAYGLHNMQRDVCGPNKPGLCPQMLPIDGSLFLQYLMNVTFKWGNETVSFDEHGDPPGRYNIMNLQETTPNEVEYVHVGSWVSLANGDKEFNIFRSLQWPERSLLSFSSSSSQSLSSSQQSLAAFSRIPESVCSRPCPKGQAKNIQSDSVKCCWVCVPCQRNQYLEDEYTCKDCPFGWWPKDDLTSGCYQIEIKYIQWTDTAPLVAIGIAICGIIITIMVMIVFIQHNNTPVVKASTRELSYMIMIGMIMAHSTTFFLLVKPYRETCFVTRVLPGLSFAIIYASLVTKTNRIARILAGSKKRIMTKKLRFMSSTAQVVISLIIIAIEIGIITAMLILERADAILDYPALDQIRLICNTTTNGIIAPLGFDLYLIAMCTVYAVKTRNVPENFNEAKFIGFTMYTTIVIWIAFIIIYFGSQFKILTMSISFSAYVALFLLFFPKCYIMLFKPEKNNRSYFTTAKNVRCHIGYVPTVGLSRDSSHSALDPTEQGKKTPSHTTTTTIVGGRESTSEPSSQKEKHHSHSSSLNIFERLRVSKQDKIAADVQRKIRAVRAAEDLDRKVYSKRSAEFHRYSHSVDSDDVTVGVTSIGGGRMSSSGGGGGDTNGGGALTTLSSVREEPGSPGDTGSPTYVYKKIIITLHPNEGGERLVTSAAPAATPNSASHLHHHHVTQYHQDRTNSNDQQYITRI